MELERITGWPRRNGWYWVAGTNPQRPAAVLVNGSRGRARSLAFNRNDRPDYVFYGPIPEPDPEECPTGWPKLDGYYWVLFWVERRSKRYPSRQLAEVTTGEFGRRYAHTRHVAVNCENRPLAKFCGPLALPEEVIERRTRALEQWLRDERLQKTICNANAIVEVQNAET